MSLQSSFKRSCYHSRYPKREVSETLKLRSRDKMRLELLKNGTMLCLGQVNSVRQEGQLRGNGVSVSNQIIMKCPYIPSRLFSMYEDVLP